jgi:hypothetical protein
MGQHGTSSVGHQVLHVPTRSRGSLGNVALRAMSVGRLQNLDMDVQIAQLSVQSSKA